MIVDDLLIDRYFLSLGSHHGLEPKLISLSTPRKPTP